MKTFLTLIFFSLFSLSSFAQTRTTTYPLVQSQESSTEELSLNGKFIIVSFDEWGRARRNCDGWGLCNAEWIYCTHNNVPVSCLKGSQKGSGVLSQDVNSNYYIDVLLSNIKPNSNEFDYFSVDDDISSPVNESLKKSLAIKAGVYSFDSSLGQFGGYRLSVN